MNFGLAGVGPGGMPRIKVGVGDYHPNKLFSSIAKGEGYQNPRVFGLVMLGLSFAFGILNFVLIFVAHIYFPYFFFPYFFYLAGPLGWGGLWLVITGQPKATADGSPVPMWTRIGLGACLVIGILAGVGASIAMHY
jgi:hypothetical protein